MGLRRLVAVPLSLALIALTGGAASAEFAAAYRQGPVGTYEGIKGVQGIRTNPATVVGVGYVHPTQVDTGSPGGNFIAIGTANGAGVDNCADDYDPNWTGYWDGELGGVYFCEDFAPDAWGAGTSVSFQIEYRACPGTSFDRWVLYLAGVKRFCKDMGSTSGSYIAVGIETTGGSTTDRNIDVKYTSLMRRGANQGSFVAWGAAGTQKLVDPNYSVDIVNDTSINTYLAPLN